MKKCPVCELNWIQDEEEQCFYCSDKTVRGRKTPSQTELQTTFVKLEEILGKTYYVRTHVEFLNRVFGTKYLQYLSCTWNYSPNIVVWMVRIDGQRHGDWINTHKGDKITEKYVGNGLVNGKPVEIPKEDYKIVVSILGDYQKIYTVLGLYKLDLVNSTPYLRYYYKVKN